VVIGAWPAGPGLAERSNVGDLEMLAARPLAGVLPEGAAGLGGEEFAAVARRGLAVTLGGSFDPAVFRETCALEP
jgi:dethiobiotin synthetase